MLYDSVYIRCPEQTNPWRQKVNSWLPRDGERGQWRVTANRHRASFGSDENVLKLGNGGHILKITNQYTFKK